MTAAVDVRDAFRIFPSRGGAAVALQGLTLRVEHGEVVVASGPSGSGKTTLLRVVGGFEELSAGSVRVFGADLGRLGRRARASFRAATLGFLDQHYARSLSPDLTCRDSVALQLELLGRDRRASLRRANELLERVGLLDRGGERPQTLSGGEQQRVALCAALAHEPRLLLADEPVGELDPASADVVYDLLAELTRGARTTALVVSHDEGAHRIADRVVHVSEGRVVDEAEPGKEPALVVSRGWVRVPRAVLDELGEPRLLSFDELERGLQVSRVAAGVPARSAGPTTAPDSAAGDDSPSTAKNSIGNGAGPVAELRDVTRRYPSGAGERIVLDALSRSFAAGTVVSVVGRSGTGKTTLLHLLAGLERPTEGEVVVAGRPLSELDRAELAAFRRRHVALVTQEPGLVPYLNAAENLELGLQIRSLRGSSVAEALEDVGLDGNRAHRVSLLSAGERQRVAIARAFVTAAPLILLDEPTARLDRANARAVGELLLRSARERRVAIVCATHDPDLVALADEVVQLSGGSAPVALAGRS
jgi:ABC-type lipoprotein export system ATPase subunit